MNLLYNKSFFHAIIISIIITIPLIMVDHFVYNGVMNLFVPISLIFATVFLMRRVEILNWFRLTIVLVIIAGTVYFAVPTYSLSEAESVIQQKFQEAVSINKVDNTPMQSDSLNPFNSHWFYTFQVIDLSGTQSVLIFNPISGKYFLK